VFSVLLKGYAVIVGEIIRTYSNLKGGYNLEYMSRDCMTDNRLEWSVFHWVESQGRK